MKKIKHIVLMFTVLPTAMLMGQTPSYYIPSPSQPFNYKQYRQFLLNSIAINDSTESGAINQIRRMDDSYGNSIFSHGQTGALFFGQNNIINCGPNAVSDKRWNEIGPNRNYTGTIDAYPTHVGTGPVSFIEFDPDDSNILLTGSWSSGLFYSENNAETWVNAGTDKFNKVSVGHCVVNKKTFPTSPKAWFISTGEGHTHGSNSATTTDGIYRSFDKGATWTKIGDYISLLSQHWAPPSMPSWNFQVTSLAIDYNDENILYASTQNGILQTIDAMSGSPTWTKIYPSAGTEVPGHEYLCSDVTILPIANTPFSSNSLIIFAAVTDNSSSGTITKFIYTNNGGASWQEVPGTSTALNSAIKINFEISPSNPNVIYVYKFIENPPSTSPDYGHDKQSKLYKFTYNFDGSNNIINPSLTFLDYYTIRFGWDTDFSVDRSNENHFISGGVSPVVHTTLPSIAKAQLGTNAPHDDYQQLVFSPHDNKIWAATHGGVYLYNANQNLWEVKNSGLGTAECIRIDNNTNKTNSLAVALNHDGVQVSNDMPYSETEWNDNWLHFRGGDGLSAVYDKNNNVIYGSPQFGNTLGKFNELTTTSAYFNTGVSTSWETVLETDDENSTGYLYSNGNSNNIDLYRKINTTAAQNLTNFATSYFPSHSTLTPSILWRYNVSNNFAILATRVNESTDGTSPFKVFLTNNIKDPVLANIVSSWWELAPPVTGTNNLPSWLSPYTDYNGNTQNSKEGFISSVCASSGNTMYFTYDIVSATQSSTGLNNKVFKVDITDWTNHIATVKDITYNLPNLCVTSCETYSSNGTVYVFIGTNRGVFYTTEAILQTAVSMPNVWSCYGDNLPYASVKSMVINSCAGTLRVGTSGRGVWEIELPDNPILINANTSISNSVIYNSTVIVKTGSTLTINAGGVVKMKASRPIIVEKGAKLVINGGKITSECGNTWQGIEVQGDMSQKQVLSGSYYPNHGWCVVQNNGNIENAIVGIKNNVTVNYDGYTTDFAKQGGGVIQCTSAKFLNCREGIKFINYINKNALNQPTTDKSFIRTTQFLTDATLAPLNYQPKTHLVMNNTKGIEITSNTFKNVTPSSYTIGKRGVGILAYDAAFSVSTPCTAFNPTTGQCTTYGTPNTFENLYYGVDAGASLATVVVNISAANFTNNHRGIILRGTTQSTAFKNNIAIGDAYTEPSGVGTGMVTFLPYGIYLDVCDAYHITENVFTDASGSSPDTDYGIIVSNTGLNTNELRKNTFSNTAFGIQAQEENYGLQLKCNKFTANTIKNADVNIMGLAMQGSIAQQQGLCSQNATDLPGNEFSHTCSVAKDLTTNSNVLYQVTYNTRLLGSEYPNVGCYNTTDYLVSFCSNPPNGEVCPPPTGGEIGGMRMAQSNPDKELNDMGQLIAAKQQLLDDGNSSQIHAGIAYATDENALKQTLLQKGPYLSDQALLELINHIPEYSAATLKEVLVNNSPLEPNVMAAVNGLNLGAKIKSQIDAYQSGMSQRRSLEKEISYLKTSRVLLYNRIINRILNDTLNPFVYDSLYRKLNFSISPQSRYLYISALMDQGNYTQAGAELATLRQSGEKADNCDYLEALITLKQQPDKAQSYKSTTGISSKIDPLLNQWPLGKSVNANVLHSSLFGTRYREQVYVDEATARDQRLALQEKTKTTIQEEGFRVLAFPNPAQNEITFMLDGATEKNDCNITIYDINSKLMSNFTIKEDKAPKTISLNDYSSGIYFYKAVSDNRVIQDKLVIIK